MAVNTIRLSWLNLINDKLSTFLSIALMTFGVGIISLLLLINHEVERQLERNLQGVDMVVGAKGSPLQLILSAVYHIDNPTGNIPLAEAKKLEKNPMVDTAIPVSIGDSYKGYRIVGTSPAYPELYNANLKKGRLWENSFEVVIGNKVAQTHQLNIGSTFHGSHGLVDGGETHHEQDYSVVGILQPNNSVLDRLILTSLESVWDMHHHHKDEEIHEALHHEDDETEEDHHEDEENDETHRTHLEEQHHDEEMITAMLVKFRSPLAHIQMPRYINSTTNMQAAVPAFEISRLVGLLGFGFKTINSIALVIMFASGISIFIGLYNAMKKRQKELALIRVYGASRSQLVKLVLLEGLIVTVLGAIFGVLLSRFALALVSIFVESNVNFEGMYFNFLTAEIWLFCAALLVGLLASIVPTIGTYRINIPKALTDD